MTTIKTATVGGGGGSAAAASNNNNNNNNNKKRPLLQTSTTDSISSSKFKLNHIKPPPLAASSQRLAAILDGKHHTNNKNKRRKVVAVPTSSTSNQTTDHSRNQHHQLLPPPPRTNARGTNAASDCLDRCTLQQARGWKPHTAASTTKSSATKPATRAVSVSTSSVPSKTAGRTINTKTTTTTTTVTKRTAADSACATTTRLPDNTHVDIDQERNVVLASTMMVMPKKVSPCEKSTVKHDNASLSQAQASFDTRTALTATGVSMDDLLPPSRNKASTALSLTNQSSKNNNNNSSSLFSSTQRRRTLQQHQKHSLTTTTSSRRERLASVVARAPSAAAAAAAALQTTFLPMADKEATSLTLNTNTDGPESRTTFPVAPTTGHDDASVEAVRPQGFATKTTTVTNNSTATTAAAPSCRITNANATLTNNVSVLKMESNPHQSATLLSTRLYTAVTTTASKKASTTTPAASYRPNLVKLNMRNTNGACRHQRVKKAKTPFQRRQDRPPRTTTTSIERPVGLCSQTGTDPVDDFVDGLSSSGRSAIAMTKRGIPLCQGHQQPCRLRTVRKTGPNKGRKFYCCAMKRHEQCNFFAWADDGDGGGSGNSKPVTKEDSSTGFVQRQVQAYLQNLQPLTLPELRKWAAAWGLATQGKRNQVWTRIALRVRDEIAAGMDEKEATEAATAAVSQEEKDSKNDSDEDDEDEMELMHAPSKLMLNPVVANTRGEKMDDQGEASLDHRVTENSDDDEEEELELMGAPSKQSLMSVPSNCNAENRKNEAEDECKMIGDLDSDDDEEGEEDESDGELEIVERVAPKVNRSNAQVECPLRARLKSLFGYDDFRPGQEWTIRRCLEGEKTLLVAPTGLGKSLCYALPAAMQPGGVVIVVSPLLSLIQDQLRELPPSLPAASLSGTTPSPTLLQDLRRGRIRILFVSPERLVSPSFRRLLSKTSWNATTECYERIMPPVSLFCVDEAHCLSQWGHNFRPCYLRLQSMLNLIQPKSVLAITATAGPRVIADITRTLGMQKWESSEGDDSKGIRIYKADRDNIDVTVRFVADHSDRLNRLVAILSPSTEKSVGQEGSLSKGSVIVYVWRQMDAEAIAEYISATNVPGKVVVYHGGMDSGARAKAQSLFLRGKARICVATVAFGLGINKSDVAGVIHMYLSASPEHYLQEIGRAGRDGSASQAIALVVPEEVQVRHSMSHSDLLAHSQVASLFTMLRKEVIDSLSKLSDERRNGLNGLCVGLSLQSTLIGCECKPETVETIFSLLEAREVPMLRVQGTFYGRAIVAPKRQSLKELARKEDLMEAILKCCQCVEPPAGEERDKDTVVGFTGHSLVGQTYGSFCFSISQCANCLGPDAEPRHVFAALRRFQESGQIDYVLDTTQPGRYIHMRLNRNLVDALAKDEASTAFEEFIAETHAGFNLAVTSSAEKVIEIYRVLRRVSEVPTEEMNSEEKSSSLHLFQSLIRDYLTRDRSRESNDQHADDTLDKAFSPKPAKKTLDLAVWSIVKHLQQMQTARPASDVTPMSLDHQLAADYTALAVTKFFHGIAPSSTTQMLCRQHNSFGALQSVEFNCLHEVVASVIG